jgi:hypothetical protein
MLYCDGTNVVSGATYMATVSTTQVDILAQGDLRLQDTTGGEYVALQAPATLAASYTLTLPVDDGTSGQALVTDGSGVLSWSTAASGDVYGPASATDNAIARFDLTTGKIIQNSVVTIADTTGNMAGVGTLSSGAITSSSLTSGRVPYAGTAGLIQDAAALTFDGTILSATRFAGALNGTVGATTPSTGAFTTLSGTGQLTLTNASNYNLYASGAGANYMAGSLGIGTTTIKQPLTVITGNTWFYSAGTTDQKYTDVNTDGTNFDFRLLNDGYSAANTAYRIARSGYTVAEHKWYSGSSVERMAIASTGLITLGAAAGSESLRVTPVASAVNYWNFNGNAAGNAPFLLLNGSDTNIPALLLTKGTGNFGFYTGTTSGLTGAAQQFNIAHTASAVNYLQVTGATTAYPTLSAQGSLANVAIVYSTKGTESHIFQTNGSVNQFLVTPTASAVNYLQATGGATGGAPTISAQGSDTNIDMYLVPKGTGGLATYGTGQATTTLSTTTLGGSIGTFDTGTAAGNGGSVVFGAASGSWRFAAIKSYATNGGSNTQGDLYFLTRRNATDATLTPSMQILSSGAVSLGFAAASSQPSLIATPVASAVNYLEIAGGATGGGVSLSAQGSDANVGLQLFAKGTGTNFYFADVNAFVNRAGANQFVVAGTASAVNYLQVRGQTAGYSPEISAQGSDANITLLYASKGTGGHYFQTGGGLQFFVSSTASAVNYLQVTGSATGSAPALTVQGSDTNAALNLASKGLSNIVLVSNGVIAATALNLSSAAVNYISLRGNTTGNAPSIVATGSDTNIDFYLQTTGTGVLQFGTYTAGIVAQAGYITIKDAGGTTRRLLVG